MPKIPGADTRQSRTLRKLASIEPESRTALAAATIDLFDAINQARLVVNPDVAPDEAATTSKLLESLYPLQDAIHDSSDQIPDALAENTPTNRPPIDSAVYEIAPEAKAADAHELIEKKLAHLDAMLMMTWGIGGATFGTLLDEYTQDNHLWACSDLASEIRQLFGLMRMLP